MAIEKHGSHAAWFDPQTKKLETRCITKQSAHHRKVLFSSLRKHGHNASFDPQTERLLNDTVSQNKQQHMKVLFSSFPKNGHTSWFDPQAENVKKTLEPCGITKQSKLQFDSRRS